MKKLAFCLLFLASGFANADDKSFGEWLVGTTSDKSSMYAGTINDSKIMLAKTCYFNTSTCFWIFNDRSSCEIGASYPVLLSTDRGATNLTMQCSVINGRQQLALTNPDLVDSALLGTKRAGIAVPMVNGTFNVHRFDMNGSLEAVNDMTTQFQIYQQRSTRTQTL